MVKNYGWNAYFATLIGACGCACLLLAPMVNLKSHIQREEIRLAKAAKRKADKAGLGKGLDLPPPATA